MFFIELAYALTWRSSGRRRSLKGVRVRVYIGRQLEKSNIKGKVVPSRGKR